MSRFVGLEYVPAGRAGIVSGVKGNHRPCHAIHGGSGTFVVYGESPKVIMKVDVGSDEVIEQDIYHDIKGYIDHKVTEKYVSELESKMKNANVNIEVSGTEISNIDDILEKLI